MPNMFKVKKYMAFLMAGLIPSILLTWALISFDLLFALLFLIVGSVLMTIIGTLLMRNPLSQLIEGEGIAIFDLASPGVIQTYLAKVKAPYVEGKIAGKMFNSVFDRNAVHYLQPPKRADISQEEKQIEIKDKNGKVTGYETKSKIVIEMFKDETNANLFSYRGYTVFFFNSILGEFYTKEMLGNMETDTFVQHLVLHLNRKVDELSNSMRDFARYIVEQTRPHKNLFENKFVWIVIIIIIGALVLLFAPSVLQQMSSLKLPAMPTNPITPLPQGA